jgi:sterol 3beta-glucosyltransferase
LKADAPPIYFGFGSMVHRQPAKTTQIILEALHQTGERGIIMTGWGGISKINIPNSVYVMDSAPHSWLFPRMKAVVHHGGAGTTAAALCAGKPAVIIPFAADQPFWGRQIASLNAGSKPIMHKLLTTDKLVKALHQVTAPSVVTCATELGEQIRNEDGVADAIHILKNSILRK